MSSSISRIITIAAAVVLTSGPSTKAEAQPTPLGARESDPNVLGWMQGFPPPPDKIITHPDCVYFSFPRLRWSVCHLREFLPTEEISRGLGAPVPLHYPSPSDFADLRGAIDAVTFTPQASDEEMTWEQSLYAN